MAPRLAYAGVGVAFFLFSLYIFLQHRHVLEYSKQVKEESDRRRREQLQSIINGTQVGLITLDDKGTGSEFESGIPEHVRAGNQPSKCIDYRLPHSRIAF